MKEHVFKLSLIKGTSLKMYCNGTTQIYLRHWKLQVSRIVSRASGGCQVNRALHLLMTS